MSVILPATTTTKEAGVVEGGGDQGERAVAVITAQIEPLPWAWIAHVPAVVSAAAAVTVGRATEDIERMYTALADHLRRLRYDAADNELLLPVPRGGSSALEEQYDREADKWLRAATASVDRAVRAAHQLAARFLGVCLDAHRVLDELDRVAERHLLHVKHKLHDEAAAAHARELVAMHRASAVAKAQAAFDAALRAAVLEELSLKKTAAHAAPEGEADTTPTADDAPLVRALNARQRRRLHRFATEILAHLDEKMPKVTCTAPPRPGAV